MADRNENFINTVELGRAIKRRREELAPPRPAVVQPVLQRHQHARSVGRDDEHRQPRPDEDPGALSARLLSEIRELVPPSISYRKRAKLSGVSED